MYCTKAPAKYSIISSSSLIHCSCFSVMNSSGNVCAESKSIQRTLSRSPSTTIIFRSFGSPWRTPARWISWGYHKAQPFSSGRNWTGLIAAPSGYTRWGPHLEGGHHHEKRPPTTAKALLVGYFRSCRKNRGQRLACIGSSLSVGDMQLIHMWTDPLHNLVKRSLTEFLCGTTNTYQESLHRGLTETK